jgi:hypothetical protein
MKKIIAIGITSMFFLIVFASINIRANSPPNAPLINGPKEIKKLSQPTYTFTATDPDGDDVMYQIVFNEGWFIWWEGPYESGESLEKTAPVVLGKSTYIITAKAKDEYGAESQKTTLEVTIVKSKFIVYNILTKFFEKNLNLVFLINPYKFFDW